MSQQTRHLPPGFTMRAPRHEDAEAVVTLLRACDVAIFGEPDTEIADVRDDWTAPGFDLTRDAWMIQRADGTAVGYAWFRRRAALDFDSDLRILPGEALDSLALAMLEAVEARTREAASGDAALLCFFTGSVETELRALLERSGYRETRTFFRMRIDLPERDEGAGAPSVAGIEIRPLRLGTDDRAIYAAVEESFADHFRHAPLEFEEWWANRARHERFDPGLWLLAWDKDRVAGGLTAYDYGDIGFISQLGVLKPWRGRGLGSALLARSFEALRAKGQRRVALGVDAENEGAVGLYIRLGMRVDSRHHLMQRSLGA